VSGLTRGILKTFWETLFSIKKNVLKKLFFCLWLPQNIEKMFGQFGLAVLPATANMYISSAKSFFT